MQYFIDVILPIPLEKLFTYRVSEAEWHFIQDGMRVAVPFGKSKIYTAIVHHSHQDPPLVYEAKEIHQILDEKPVITSLQLQLWQWMSSYYMCTIGEVMRAALPSAFLLESESIISRKQGIDIDDTELKDDEFLVFEALEHQATLKVDDISNILEKKTVIPVLKRLIDKQVIRIHEELYEKYQPKLVRHVKLSEKHQSDEGLSHLMDALKRAPKQREIILSFFDLKKKSDHGVRVSDLIKRANASSAQIKALVDKNILLETYVQTDRVIFDEAVTKGSKSLNSYQSKALNKIKQKFDNHNVTLFHGVTSSGKTELYVKLIEDVLQAKKQVLYLVPEIALTSQLIQRLQLYFGGIISVYHSRYSLNERVEVWNHVLNNSPKAQIILGARSSIFLPFHELGLVIVDEEHELSYKQFDPAPRYHARDTAIILANYFNAKTILGSATPSLESYSNAMIENKYGYVELNRRFNDVLMPDIELVDIKDKHRRKRMKGHFSDRLIEEMGAALNNDYQVILFQNRRGFSPIIECQSCGHSPQCPNCDVSLTFHQFRDQLRCHYCGFNVVMHKACEACGNPTLDSKGFGTEQVVEEVKQLFPDFKVARMDLDTTRGKHSYEKIIGAFEAQETKILVGTQMLTKGLDFRQVKLVGIMNADSLLNFPDFRAHERSFQLMQQVAGRAGRTDERGKVLIQTYNPHHRILQQVAANDYETMFKEQMDDRHTYKYPPVYRLIKITLRHRDFNRVNTASDWMAKSLRQLFGAYVLGPEFPAIARIRNQYNKNILIKIPEKQSLGKTKEAILRVKNSFLNVKDFRPIKVILNVDNY